MAITTQTFEGLAGGMNLALPGEEIADNEARYIQDALLDYPGLIRRRGPVMQFAGTPTFPTPVSGLVQTLDPVGTNRLAVLRGDTVNGFLSVLSSNLSSYVDLPWNGALPTAPPASPYRIVDAKPALTGGVWIGTSSQYAANGPVQSLAMWRGANVADYTTGTVTAARGSTTVTGGSGASWLGNVTPGSFLFANTDDGGTMTFIGVVKSVDSATQVTLGVGALYALTARAYKFTSIRGFAPRVVKGRITTTVASPTVTGANTKFLAQGVNTGVWNLYRASDYGWIGKVTTVNNDVSITLAANAALALNNERFVALRQDADWNYSTMAVTDRKVGFLNAVYAERNWYANLGQRFELTSRLWFSDTSDPEAVDMAAFDGDFIDVGSSRGANSPIKAIMPAYNSLLVFKENETFGVFGASPTQFEVRKVEDDGTLGGMSVQSYGGGVIWAGREGIHFYDGIQAENVTQPKLGDYYKNMIRAFDPTKYRMWSMMIRDHYFLFIENAQPTRAVVKGAVSSTPTKLTIVINMNSRAVSLMTNVNLRGAVLMPADTGQETWYVANSATQGFICAATSLFDNVGNDTITCDGGTPGPDFYMESKKYNAGDAMRLKLFKQLAINYLTQGDNLKVDTVVGLNDIGRTSSTELIATVFTWDNLPVQFGTWNNMSLQTPTWDALINSVFKPKRIKFLKRSQNLAFRIYQKSAAVTNLRLGPFQIGFKYQRPGRI